MHSRLFETPDNNRSNLSFPWSEKLREPPRHRQGLACQELRSGWWYAGRSIATSRQEART